MPRVSEKPLVGVPLRFPFGGIVENVAYGRQPEGTTAECQNVRPFDFADRMRGSQRPGVSRFVKDPLVTVPEQIAVQDTIASTTFDGAAGTAVIDTETILIEERNDTSADSDPVLPWRTAVPALSELWVYTGGGDEATVDWTGETAIKQAQTLLHDPTLLGTFEPPRDYALRTTLTTFLGEGTTPGDGVRYYAGFVLRVDRDNSPFNGIFIGWERVTETSSYRWVAIHIKDDGAGNGVFRTLAVTSTEGTAAATTFNIELRVAGERLEFYVGEELKILYDIVPGDTVSTVNNLYLGLTQIRQRDTGAWAATDAATFTSFAVHNVSVVEGFADIQDLNRIIVVNDSRVVLPGELKFEETFSGGTPGTIIATANGWQESQSDSFTILGGSEPPAMGLVTSPSAGDAFRYSAFMDEDEATIAASQLDNLNSHGVAMHHADFETGLLLTGPLSRYVLRMRIKTIANGDTTDGAEYFAGFVIRFPLNFMSGDDEEQFAIGWHRQPGANTYKIAIRKYEPGTDSWIELAETADLGAPDAQFHTLELRGNGHFLQVLWDNAVQTWQTGVGQKLFANSNVYDISQDGYNDTDNQLWGFCFWRRRTANDWGASGSDPIIGFRWDDIQYFEGELQSRTRENKVTAISGGTLKIGTRQDGFQDPIVGAGRRVSAIVPTVQSAFVFNKLFVAEGTTYQFYDALIDQFVDWDATLGTLPGGNGSDGPGDGNPRCRLVAVYRGRVVLAGKSDEPANWFMSRITDPFDWAYGADDPNPDDPVAGNLSTLGELGDAITALIPYHNTQLIFGADSSIWVLTGDPFDPNGQSSFHSLTRDVGVVGPRAWAQGPNKAVYVYATDGIYVIRPNEFNIDEAQRLSSAKLDRSLRSIDFESHNISLVWDIIRHGLWIFATPIQPGPTRHFFWDERTDSFWPDVMPEDVGPVVATLFDADEVNDRTILLGGRDSRIREVSADARDDDGQAIDSFCRYTLLSGPSSIGKTTWTRLDAVLATGSDSLDYEVSAHRSAQSLNDEPAVVRGRWIGSGPQRSDNRRVLGSRFSLRVGNNRPGERWSIESAHVATRGAGLVRSRRGL